MLPFLFIKISVLIFEKTRLEFHHCIQVVKEYPFHRVSAVILVTGGGGRLGVNLIKVLTTSGYEAGAFDLPNISWEIFEDIQGVEPFPVM